MKVKDVVILADETMLLDRAKHCTILLLNK